MTDVRIVNGRVYDPANGVDGDVRDVCIAGGRVVAAVGDGARVLDAQGMVVMPGGVDMHAHIAGSKVNLARRFQPEDHRDDVEPRTEWTRSGVGSTVPSTFVTGYRYARLGYTTVMEAAVAPLAAIHAHEELDDTPVIDKGIFVLMGNNELALRLIGQGQREQVRHYVAWILNRTKAYAVKLVNPGGVETWKSGGGNVTDLDQPVPHFDVTPRQIVEALTEAGNALGLPHPVHIHCNNLGVAGNYRTTLATMQTIGEQRAHFTHIQFHAYGGKRGGKPTSKAAEIADYLNAHPNITADVGQVMFGRSTTMTADAPVEYALHQLTGKKWVSADIEQESGCGIVPFIYQDTNYVHALQWAIGLELFLLCADPWRLALTTDHPNGGSFLSYPRLIRLLMDRGFREDEARRVNEQAVARTQLLNGLNREYTLSEIAIITRAGPARILGLPHKGHLGVGADGDVTIYAEHADKEQMFSRPRYVIKDGVVVVERGRVVTHHAGRTLLVAPPYDAAIEDVIRPFFDAYYTVQLDNYGVDAVYVQRGEVVACHVPST